MRIITRRSHVGLVTGDAMYTSPQTRITRFLPVPLFHPLVIAGQERGTEEGISH